MANPDDSELMISDVLRRSGWTRTMVDDFLGEPDRQVPRYGGGVIKLYALSRVETAEHSPTFQSRATRVNRSRPARQAAATRAIRVRRDRVMAYVDGLEICLPELSGEALRRLAVKSYNCLWSERGNYEKHASENDAPEFLNRIMVNYLRHELTNYEHELIRLHGSIGADEARCHLRERVLNAIADGYPSLREECQKQAGETWTSQRKRGW